MKNDARTVFVAFSSESVKSSFEKLKEGASEEKELYAFINRALDDLKEDPFTGIKIPRKLWPKEYASQQIDNLWKYDLPNA